MSDQQGPLDRLSQMFDTFTAVVKDGSYFGPVILNTGDGSHLEEP